jgi:hypothetical protein
VQVAPEDGSFLNAASAIKTYSGATRTLLFANQSILLLDAASANVEASAMRAQALQSPNALRAIRVFADAGDLPYCGNSLLCSALRHRQFRKKRPSNCDSVGGVIVRPLGAYAPKAIWCD